MTELEFFREIIPELAEIIIECRKLSTEEYREFRKNLLLNIPEEIMFFGCKVLLIIDELKDGAPTPEPTGIRSK